MAETMTKFERVTAFFHGEEVDRVPVCFWWHFPSDLKPEDMVQRHLDFFHDTGRICSRFRRTDFSGGRRRR